MAVPQVGGQGAFQHSVLQGGEAFDFIHGHDAAKLSVSAGLGDIHAGDVGHHARAQSRYQHLIEIAALADGFHLDAGVGGLKHGDDHIVDHRRFSVAIGVPEGDGHRLLRRSKGAHAQRHRQGQKQRKQLFHGVIPPYFFGASIIVIVLPSSLGADSI